MPWPQPTLHNLAASFQALPRHLRLSLRNLRSRISTTGVRHMFSSKRGKVIAVAATAGVIATVAACSSGTTSTASGPPATASPAATSSPADGFGSGSGSNAKSGPAAGGSIGTITSVSSSGFTLTTSTGEKVTIKEEDTLVI